MLPPLWLHHFGAWRGIVYAGWGPNVKPRLAEAARNCDIFILPIELSLEKRFALKNGPERFSFFVILPGAAQRPALPAKDGGVLKMLF